MLSDKQTLVLTIRCTQNVAELRACKLLAHRKASCALMVHAAQKALQAADEARNDVVGAVQRGAILVQGQACALVACCHGLLRHSGDRINRVLRAAMRCANNVAPRTSNPSDPSAHRCLRLEVDAMMLHHVESHCLTQAPHIVICERLTPVCLRRLELSSA